MRPIVMTHHCLLNVNFLTAGQTKVCYLRHKVVPYKNIPGRQIPVYELMPTEQKKRIKRMIHAFFKQLFPL